MRDTKNRKLVILSLIQKTINKDVYLTLALFVTAVFANHSNDTVPAYNFAVAADLFHRSTNFHDKSPKRLYSIATHDILVTIIREVITPIPGEGKTFSSAQTLADQTLALEISLFHQALILMRHQMGLNLSHKIHNDHNDDQQ